MPARDHKRPAVSEDEPSSLHYELPGLLERITNGFSKMGKNVNDISVDDLAPIDEFHLGGPKATDGLIDLLGVESTAHVLDAGCGLGGPARRLARSTGCKVTGIDLSREYCTVGNHLTAATGLGSKVHLEIGDVTELSRYEDHSFDGAWTLHVGMNVADKEAFYSEVFRVLKPNSSFLLYDVLEGPATGDIHYPVPWARDASSSFLVSRDRLEPLLQSVGFQVAGIQNKTASALELISRNTAANTQPALGLHLVLGPVVKEALPNLKQNLQESRVELMQFECRKV
jgi:ubiquinone/menaquinone biosynthesis C-methylase UbiE